MDPQTATPTDAREKKLPQSFEELILEVGHSLSSASRLDEIVDQIVSFHHRFPLELGRKSLSSGQRAILEVLGARTGAFQWGAPLDPSDALSLTIGMRSYGRLILGFHPSLAPEDRIYGTLATTPEERTAIATRELELREAWRVANQPAEDYLGGLDPAALSEALDRVEFMVDHTDPVLIYVEEKLYTLYGKLNNLIEERKIGSGPFLFKELRQTPLENWSELDRCWVACMALLQEAGFRGEEFNGLQLCIPEVARHLDHWLPQLAAATRTSLPEKALSLPEKARLARQLKDQARKDHFLVRWVNGLNFYKEERLIPELEIRSDGSFIAGDLDAFLESRGGLKTGDFADLSALFQAWVPLALDGEVTSPEPSRWHPLEEMIAFLVGVAVRETHSDIGMSRSFRDYARLADLDRRQAHAEICNLSLMDYFCCVVPSPAMQEMAKPRPGLLFTILNAISQRMNYNSWHYMPSHFPASALPKERHFYFAPRMADTAEWSNLHHAGHMLATVLYSIRSPGEVRCGERTFWGLMDLRLMRQKGSPYSREELKTAIAHTRVLRRFYQALMDTLLARGASFTVTAFDKPWYQKHFP